MPKFNTIDEVSQSGLYDHVEMPAEYYPHSIGPGGFSPRTMYMHALAVNKSLYNEYTIKSWIVLWLLDHIDWDKVEGEMYESN